MEPFVIISCAILVWWNSVKDECPDNDHHQIHQEKQEKSDTLWPF